MVNVLVIGSGGREHALCWRLKQSPSVTQVYCAPGNGGIAKDAVCVALKASQEIIDFCRKNSIALVVIGPEQPLVEGLSDQLAAAGIPVFGPSQYAAQLEGSKGFMKALCKKYNIPTAKYEIFTDAKAAKAYAAAMCSSPGSLAVIKADGLAAGKGVIIATSVGIAEAATDDIFSGKFGHNDKIVIEEFLEGEEVSFFALTDGETAVEFGYAQDHKRAYDGDQGPNTGGMGTYAPPPVMTDALRREVMETIIRPTVEAMKKEGHPFRGVLFAGLMLTKDGPKLLEYNVRFGDPETQVLMMRFQGDLYQALLACTSKASGDSPSLSGTCHLSPDTSCAVCVVMAANGYPGAYEKGNAIRGLERAAAMPGVKIFHAGTALKDGQIIATGGRVLGVTALGATIAEAKARAYGAVDAIDWPEGFCRRDIAWRAIES